MSLFVNKFFCLGLACLLNESKIKAQAWVIYKQNKHELTFYQANAKLSMIGLVYLQWFIYNPMWDIYLNSVKWQESKPV